MPPNNGGENASLLDCNVRGIFPAYAAHRNAWFSDIDDTTCPTRATGSVRCEIEGKQFLVLVIIVCQLLLVRFATYFGVFQGFVF